MGQVFQVISETLAVEEMTKKFDLVVLEVHSEDFIKNPRDTLRRICNFLEVECSERYLQTCFDMTYRSVSRTRDSIVWSKEALSAVEQAIKLFPCPSWLFIQR